MAEDQNTFTFSKCEFFSSQNPIDPNVQFERFLSLQIHNQVSANITTKEDKSQIQTIANAIFQNG
jgi:hypothetical protein